MLFVFKKLSLKVSLAVFCAAYGDATILIGVLSYYVGHKGGGDGREVCGGIHSRSLLQERCG
jgi:hypothetical protein